jgi:hypothetical protein
MLELLAESSVFARRLVAADADSAVCDVPTLLITRLPVRPPRLPRDMDGSSAALRRPFRRSTA